ncbi:hypothetical protein HY622_01830 [Candidatus Uhrbacteria bacterium]|nr:hypothetical protein [Candidatus Uhrbacteria bacterium]
MQLFRTISKKKFIGILIVIGVSIVLVLAAYIPVPGKKELCGDGFEPYYLEIKCFHPPVYLWERLRDEYHTFVDPYGFYLSPRE